ncbi:MAG: F0F1 ATP synthase subunit alpha [Roseiarcus sp.]
MTKDVDAPTNAWLERARTTLGAVEFGARVEQIGRVEEVEDGVALVSGLPDVGLDELLRFDKGQFGFAQALERDRIGCVLLDDVDTVEAGDIVRGTGNVVRVPVGPALLGRIVDPLGRPIDGRGPIEAESHEPIERPAPGILERDLVTEPVQTGLVVIDALFALGRGQRELIIGDRAIGKTTIAVDTIINQRSSDIVCVYVAVGQKTSSVRRAIEAIEAHGEPSRCVIVVAGAASSPGLQWIAPFAGFTIAEYFRDRGQHALIVVDDLTKHAAAHREIALLTRQSPGREAYPGDVFYVHARLLERAAKLSTERGGGSLTALPIAETDAGNLSAYIPTNLISIADGQIVLDSRLFNEGRKPAVDAGVSVSRVGGKTQAPALREAAERLRLDYAQFVELEMFTRFGGMPDPRVRAQLTRGERIRAILDQPRHAPLRLADETALVLAVQFGLLDPLPLVAVGAFRRGLPDALDRSCPGVVRAIERTGTLDEASAATLREALRAFASSFAPSAPPAPGRP